MYTSDCGFTYWIDGPMEVHVHEYIRHLHVLNQQMDIDINMKHDQINQLLHENQEHAHRLNNIETNVAKMASQAIF